MCQIRNVIAIFCFGSLHLIFSSSSSVYCTKIIETVTEETTFIAIEWSQRVIEIRISCFFQVNLSWLDFLGSAMETNIPVSTSITNIWQNHCNGGTSQTSPPMQTNDMEPIARKKTWLELKESVTELRKQLSRLSTMVPMNIQFRKLSDSRTRIYFLGTPPNGWETTLLCTDITPAMLSPESNDEHDLQQQQQHRTRFVNKKNTLSISSSSLTWFGKCFNQIFFLFCFID